MLRAVAEKRDRAMKPIALYAACLPLVFPLPRLCAGADRRAAQDAVRALENHE
jgi:hypothetical protein